MREEINHLNYYDEQIPIVCNINVLEVIQHKYGSFDKWSRLIAPEITETQTETDSNVPEFIEPDYSALKFGTTAMINEGIDIENELKGENKPFKTEKQVARIISSLGIDVVTASVAGEIIDFAPESAESEPDIIEPEDLEDEELKNL